MSYCGTYDPNQFPPSYVCPTIQNLPTKYLASTITSVTEEPRGPPGDLYAVCPTGQGSKWYFGYPASTGDEADIRYFTCANSPEQALAYLQNEPASSMCFMRQIQSSDGLNNDVTCAYQNYQEAFPAHPFVYAEVSAFNTGGPLPQLPP